MRNLLSAVLALSFSLPASAVTMVSKTGGASGSRSAFPPVSEAWASAFAKNFPGPNGGISLTGLDTFDTQALSPLVQALESAGHSPDDLNASHRLVSAMRDAMTYAQELVAAQTRSWLDAAGMPGGPNPEAVAALRELHTVYGAYLSGTLRHDLSEAVERSAHLVRETEASWLEKEVWVDVPSPTDSEAVVEARGLAVKLRDGYDEDVVDELMGLTDGEDPVLSRLAARALLENLRSMKFGDDAETLVDHLTTLTDELEDEALHRLVARGLSAELLKSRSYDYDQVLIENLDHLDSETPYLGVRELAIRAFFDYASGEKDLDMSVDAVERAIAAAQDSEDDRLLKITEELLRQELAGAKDDYAESLSGMLEELAPGTAVQSGVSASPKPMRSSFTEITYNDADQRGWFDRFRDSPAALIGTLLVLAALAAAAYYWPTA